MTTEKNGSKTRTGAAIGAFVIIALAIAAFFYIQSKTGSGQPIPPDNTIQPGEEVPTAEPTPSTTIVLSDGNAQPQTVLQLLG